MAGLFFLTGVLVYGAYLVAFEADRKYQFVDNLLTMMPLKLYATTTEDPSYLEHLQREGITQPPYFFMGNH